jgi:hypothetical protein
MWNPGRNIDGLSGPENLDLPSDGDLRHPLQGDLPLGGVGMLGHGHIPLRSQEGNLVFCCLQQETFHSCNGKFGLGKFFNEIRETHESLLSILVIELRHSYRGGQYTRIQEIMEWWNDGIMTYKIKIFPP